MEARLLLIACMALTTACGTGSSDDDDTGVDTDTGTETDTGTGDEIEPDDWIGEPCTVEGDECAELSGGLAQAICFATDDTRGFCTMACEPATSADPGADPCGDEGVCSDFAWLLGGVEPSAFCAQACVPRSDGNPCRAEYLRCDPASWAFEKLTSTCLLPACTSDLDCPVPVGRDCAGPGDCDDFLGESCVDLNGVLECVFYGTCDTSTGRCGHFGKAGVQVGAPCETTYDCGRNMECLVEQEYTANGAELLYAGGYCTKDGCAAVTKNFFNLGNQSSEVSVIDELGCGTLGVCKIDHRSGGRCYHRCHPEISTSGELSCRQFLWDGVPGDKAGQYECYDQSAYGISAYGLGDPAVIGMAPVTSSPYCSPVGASERCQGGMAMVSSSSTCAELFALVSGVPDYWGMEMKCRDPITGQEVQDGFCLDSSTSHWTGLWSDSEPDAGVDGG